MAAVTYQLQPPTTFQVYAVSITNSSAQIIGSARGRASLSFHNPGSVDVYICPTQDAHGNALTAAVGAAGMIIVMAGNTQEIDLPGNVGWNGIAASSAVLTILEYVSPTLIT